jgi:hypothetical protein
MFAGLIIAFIQMRFLRKQIQDDHEWKRREKSLSFSQIHSQHLRDVKQKLNKSFGYIQQRKDPLSNQELQEACKNDEGLREDINYFLAYLENIGIACRHNIANFQIIFDMLGNTIVKYYFLFQPIIKESQTYNSRLWVNIIWLVGKIEEKKQVEIMRLEKTG